MIRRALQVILLCCPVLLAGCAADTQGLPETPPPLPPDLATTVLPTDDPTSNPSTPPPDETFVVRAVGTGSFTLTATAVRDSAAGVRVHYRDWTARTSPAVAVATALPTDALEGASQSNLSPMARR